MKHASFVIVARITPICNVSLERLPIISTVLITASVTRYCYVKLLMMLLLLGNSLFVY